MRIPFPVEPPSLLVILMIIFVPSNGVSNQGENRPVGDGEWRRAVDNVVKVSASPAMTTISVQSDDITLIEGVLNVAASIVMGGDDNCKFVSSITICHQRLRGAAINSN